MDHLDTKALIQLAQQVGLLTEDQIQEALTEVDVKSENPDPFLKVLERKGRLTPWQSYKLLRGDPDGYYLGGYRILYKVASGSFGRVFRADDPRTGRVVAIKVLRRRWSEDQQRIDLFEREGKVGLGLRHPNIVETITVNNDAPTGQWYIVMDFVEGGNLRDILAIRKTLEPSEALRMLEDCASAIAYAHAHGVSHRDIKPTNILISTTQSAKLVDFGLAQFFSDTEEKGKTKAKIERTVDYAGLEKATGVKQGDTRSDIYFLGCVFYEMLTGRPPLEATRNKLARMHRQRFDNVRPIGRHEIRAPASVFHLVETMMALEPKLRYQTATQLLEAIRAARREIEGHKDGRENKSGPRSVFIVESDERLQDSLREKLKEMGFRVLLAGDPMRALDRFRQQPYDALIVDARTTGQDGFLVFQRVFREVDRTGLNCAGILILNNDQADWAQALETQARVTVMENPVTLRRLLQVLRESLPEPSNSTVT
jgi:serine/threonine protein kinase